MSQSKIEFRLGAMRFTGEGEKEWVTKQLDKIIDNAAALLRVSSGSNPELAANGPGLLKKHIENQDKNSGNRWKSGTVSTLAPKITAVKSSFQAKELSAFIQEKKAGSNQRTKFLAAALWLAKNGKSNPSTRDVTQALKAARVSALINPSQYLNQNVKQGFLKKSGSGFTITKKGESAL